MQLILHIQSALRWMYTDLHFRGEYWQAPPQYQHMTKRSIYSIPKYPEYPFLDPHWIVRVEGGGK